MAVPGDPRAAVVAVAHAEGVDFLMEGAKSTNNQEFAALVRRQPCGRFVDCGRGMICVRARGSDDGVCTALPRDYCEGGLQKLARQASKVQ